MPQPGRRNWKLGKSRPIAGGRSLGIPRFLNYSHLILHGWVPAIFED
jgi:hypothetical protein